VKFNEAKMKSIYFATMASASLLFMGCGSTDTREQENVGVSGATLLFTDHFADGGVMQVVEQDDGALGFFVSAPIRSEDASKAMRASVAKGTLAEVYSALHDASAAVPEVLEELSARLELEQQAIGTFRARPATPTLIEVEDKSKSAFINNTCLDFLDFPAHRIYLIAQCKYNTVVNRVTTNPWMDSRNDPPAGPGSFIDRSYGWNDSSWTADFTLSASTWVPTIPANHNGWVQWGGLYIGATARLSIPAGKNGPLGITVHHAGQLN
jgi:hypothetical protein